MMSRAFTGFLAIAVAVSVAAGVQSATPIDIEVYPAFAPQGTISPSWTDYVTNATAAIAIDAPIAGNPDHNPSGYERVVGPVTPLDMVYTDYNSWDAMADPNPAFGELGASFQSEFGNRIHFGAHIVTDGTTDFALQDLSWALDSDDETNYFDQEGTFGSANYSKSAVGIRYGTDGMPGGGDDVIYNDGEAGNLPVHELIYVGVGDGFLSREPGKTGQEDINVTLSDLLAGCPGPETCVVGFEGIYRLNVEGSDTPLIGTSTVDILIEPAYGGDFDHNRQIESRDKDLLTTAISSGSTSNLYDVDGDGSVDFMDLDMMVHDIANTFFGDADCNGTFNSEDLVKVFIQGKYLTGESAVWSSGDWNADGVFDDNDITVAFIDGGYNGTSAVAVVPEPSGIVLTLMGVFLLVARRRRR